MTHHKVKSVRSLLALDAAGEQYELTLSTDQGVLRLIVKREQLEAVEIMRAELPPARPFRSDG